MKRNLRVTVMGLLVSSAVLSGCSPFRLFGLRDFSEISRQKNTRIITLQPGMTPEQAVEHIGPSSNSRVPNPIRSEVYPAGDDTFRALFFYTGMGMGYVTSILDSDLMPVVFKNERLDGWGWSYWKSTVTQYNIRIGNE